MKKKKKKKYPSISPNAASHRAKMLPNMVPLRAEALSRDNRISLDKIVTE
jgi:hypothetical protein